MNSNALNPAGAALSPVEIRVEWPADVPQAANLAKQYADSLGFPGLQCDEIALVVTELGSNLIKHARGGAIRLAEAKAGEQRAIEIESMDKGPGITDVDQAIVDGYSTAGGLGLGLGTVNRLMDELDMYSASGGGLHVVCRRWLRSSANRPVSGDLAFSAATRSCCHQTENGDTFLFKRWESNALAGVIDGLGHGQFAQRASQTARQYVERHFDQPLELLFRGAGRACRSTRGVVMALARFDLARGTVALASVGNVESYLIGAQQPLSILARRGIVGLNAPAPAIAEYPWTGTNLLIMHSDGVRTHWDRSRFSDLLRGAPTEIARRMLLEDGKPDDDATVIVAKSL